VTVCLERWCIVAKRIELVFGMRFTSRGQLQYFVLEASTHEKGRLPLEVEHWTQKTKAIMFTIKASATIATF